MFSKAKIQIVLFVSAKGLLSVPDGRAHAPVMCVCVCACAVGARSTRRNSSQLRIAAAYMFGVFRGPFAKGQQMSVSHRSRVHMWAR